MYVKYTQSRTVDDRASVNVSIINQKIVNQNKVILRLKCSE